MVLQNNYRNKIISQTKTVDYFQEEQRLKSKINLQKIGPTFGFNNLKADWLFLNFIQYFGDKYARKKTGYSLTSEYFATIINYDVQFIAAYLTLANANTMYAGQPEKSIAFIEQILNSASPGNSSQLYYLLWLYKAYDELFFLGDIQAAQFSYSQIKQWSEQEQPNLQNNITANYFPNPEFFNTNPDITQAQILAWSTVLPHVRDIETQQKIRKKITTLKSRLVPAK
ncbi:MAG: hypothetical protein QNJ65_10975 [Xenococcaceae cyanobacterium MO_234.B1]|nr:hypothetical protein [Xenococcaceae cyanobacterium MO_234.B1]